ncbi:hypothetical protein B296_00024533 [Ensete ventricosum]|uniref:Uncharacterized protein n=1 Tax=Ensete ventricosum TaxID=4639 RepID=A0A426ZZD9_ENSVE|nr:hypothetical protein B296_00024533 [Ensete ventricosum]
MSEMPQVKSEEPLEAWRSSLSGSIRSKVDQLRAELETSKQHRKGLEQEVSIACAGLQEARDDRARLEEEVLPLTEAATLLQSELKAEGLKAITQYKASQGFESGLVKMGQVSYEFGYRVAVERFRAKYLNSTVEENLFAELPEDANMKMDLCQPFDDSATLEN